MSSRSRASGNPGAGRGAATGWVRLASPSATIVVGAPVVAGSRWVALSRRSSQRLASSWRNPLTLRVQGSSTGASTPPLRRRGDRRSAFTAHLRDARLGFAEAVGGAGAGVRESAAMGSGERGQRECELARSNRRRSARGLRRHPSARRTAAGLRSRCERAASFTGHRGRLAIEGLDLRCVRTCR